MSLDNPNYDMLVTQLDRLEETYWTALDKKDAEIERLKKDLENQTRLAGSYLTKLFACQALITELVDALDLHTDFEFRHEVEGLIGRGREAT